MKILLLNQTFYPDSMATSQQLTDLALFLTGKGHQVTVITDRCDYEHRRTVFPAHEVYEGIEIHRVPATMFGKKSFARRVVDSLSFELLAFFQLLRIPRQDIVISFTSPPLIGFIGTIYCLLSRSRSVQWLMDINPDAAIAVGYVKQNSLVGRALLKVFELTLKKAASIVVLDRWMTERVAARGAARANITVIPPWPAHEPTPPRHEHTREENLFRKAHGLGNKFVVMYSGNHSVVHPLDTLLGAAVKLKDADDIAFVFVGGGSRTKDVTECMAKHGLKNVWQLPLQPRELLSESLSCADLHVVVMGNAVTGLVHTSKLYGILAAGIPYVFVGPRASHVADLLAECPYGYHVEHGQVEPLVEAIRAAQRLTPDERRTFERENFRYLVSHYTVKHSLDIFEAKVLGPLSEEGGAPVISLHEPDCGSTRGSRR